MDAVNELLSSFEVPVIFITAYPERFLTGERPEPAFLIAKPFEPATLSALTAAIACDALGPENVIGVRMASRHTSAAGGHRFSTLRAEMEAVGGAQRSRAGDHNMRLSSSHK